MNHLTNSDIHIVSDSRAALQIICNDKITSYLQNNIRNKINQIAKKVSVLLHWIPGHSGDSGNERADLLARKAGDINSAISYNKILLSMVKNSLLNILVDNWQKEWNLDNTGGTFYSFAPNIKDLFSKKFFNTNFFVTQLFTGHGKFKSYLHRFGFDNTPFCECDGDSIQDNLHIIFHCDKFNSSREQLMKTVILNRHN